MKTPRIPPAIWVLGLVSLLMDVSSETIHALLPVFVVAVLGASTVSLGIIEGIAEATASITKVFSGVLSDRLGQRKRLTVFGYGLAALTKPFFPLATSAAWIFTARFVDRIGKGIRGAPRDALVADLSPPEVRGAAFGLRQSLDTVGALLGPLMALVLMNMLNDVRSVFWVAVLPAVAAVALLVFGVHEPARHEGDASLRKLPRWSELRLVDRSYWAVVCIGSVFMLARFSEAFLVLRAHERGLSLAWTPLALVVMNSVYSVSAYPFGRLADRVERVWLLVSGLVILIVSNLVLALGQQVAVSMIGVALWGLHMGLTQGQLATMVADTAPPDLRGSAFGLFHFVSGVATLLASLLAGVLWQWRGPALTFASSAAFSAVALVGLLSWQYGRRRMRPAS